MSHLSDLAIEFEEDWRRKYFPDDLYGYEHIDGEYLIVWRNCNVVTLYANGAEVFSGRLETAVLFVRNARSRVDRMTGPIGYIVTS